MSSPLEKIILTLHEQGLDEEQIYIELKSRNLITNNTAHTIIDTIHTKKVYQNIRSTSWSQVTIRTWGVICTIIGLILSTLITLAIIRETFPSPTLCIGAALMLIIGITLIRRPQDAFNSFD